MMKSRNRTADLLKGVAVILMVQVHIVELFAQQSIFDSFAGSIFLFLGGPPAAPVFMTVMGYFIAKGSANISKSIVRGFKLIGFGLLLNFGLNFHLFIKIYNQTIVASQWPYLFGVDILFLAGLSIILISVFQKIFKKKLIIYILLIILIFLIPILLSYPENTGAISYFMALFYSDVWWSYFPVIPWLAYPVAGFLFYLVEPSINNIIKRRTYRVMIISISAIALILTIRYGISIASNLHAYYHHDFLYYLFVVNFMIFWSLLFNIITSFSKNYLTDYIEWMGRNVTVYYVIQWLIIGNIATGIYKTQNSVQLIIWFAVIIVITSLLTLLWNKRKKLLQFF